MTFDEEHALETFKSLITVSMEGLKVCRPYLIWPIRCVGGQKIHFIRSVPESAPPSRRAKSMKQSIGQVAIVVSEYDEAITFYTSTLGFTLIEDTYIPEQDKRWVIVTPPNSTESRVLLARAANDEQASRIGNQTGGRVFMFLFTDDFWRDYKNYQSKGVVFVREPKEETYGTVAVFEDLYGNLWDLLQPKQLMQDHGMR